MKRAYGAVAAGHPLTAAAAEEILREGGNAFDAVIAAAAAACVVEPVLASLGGGGFLLAHPAGAAPIVHDFFAQTPRRRRDTAQAEFYPVEADFGRARQTFHIGMGSAATPGLVAGLFDIHRNHGTVPIQRLFAPAIRAARDGVIVEPLQSYVMSVVAPIYAATPASRRIYGAMSTGNVHHQPELADTLDALVVEGESLFYRGELAQRLASLSETCGGHLCAEDLSSYQVLHREPLRLAYRDATILTNPPPTSGGVLVAFGLALLEPLDLTVRGPEHPESLAALARVLQATVEARPGVLAEVERSGTLDPELLVRYRRQVTGHPRMSRGTTHISVLDGPGNAAALTLSNGEGCGHLLPGTGIMLNNMLGEEDINPHGFHAWPENRRMTSMMAPTLVERDGLRVAMGSGGSNRIRSAVLQVITHLLDFADDPLTAVNRPRLHAEADRLSIEGGQPAPALDHLLQRWPDAEVWPDRNLFFGGVHLALKDQRSGFAAVGDPRRGGIGRVV